MTQRPRLLLATGDLNTLGLLRQACQEDFRVLEGAADAEDARRLAAEHEPTMAVIDMALPGGSTARLVSDLLERDPTLLVVALLSDDSPDSIRRATSLGARDFLAPPLDGDRIREVLGRVVATRGARIEALEQARQRDAIGGIWTFASASGGSGQTTLMLAMANELAAVGTRVVVVDLDWLFADAGLYLGLEPTGPTIHELLEEPEPTTPETLERYLRTHSSGIRVLADPPRATEAAALDPQAVLAVVLALREVCDYLLVDLPTGLGDLQLPYMDASSFVFATATGSIGAMKNLSRMVEVLLEAGFKKGRLRPVLTAFQGDLEGAAPLRRRLERLDSELSGIFPYDRETTEDAIRLGQPVTRIDPRSPFTQAVREYLAPVLARSRRPKPRAESPGLLARLFG